MQVVTENVLRAGPAARGGACTRFGETESPAATINTIQEFLLCPHCVLPTVLGGNRIDPNVAPREHSLQLHFTRRLVGHMGEGRRPSLSCLPCFPK